ncbi:hypothetical protein WMY93_015267 [Mugilogobius chulae]|uniref:C-type lectin domain-containing protein n=1 Tax=Mugilogobius chulae TaxID=88201 RepID=A0AAW0NWQ8_9GOBI
MCVAEDQNHGWRALSCSQRLPFYCYHLVQHRSVLKIQFQSDLDMSDPRIYRTLLEKSDCDVSNTGLTLRQSVLQSCSGPYSGPAPVRLRSVLRSGSGPAPVLLRSCSGPAPVLIRDPSGPVSRGSAPYVWIVSVSRNCRSSFGEVVKIRHDKQETKRAQIITSEPHFILRPETQVLLWERLWSVEETQVCGGDSGLWRRLRSVEETQVCGGDSGLWRRLRSVEETQVCGGDSVLCEDACAQELIKQFIYNNNNLNWAEAQQFCRKTYTDLATIHSTEEMSELQRTGGQSGDAWIGLNTEALSYANWAPDTSSGCPCMNSEGTWTRCPCAVGRPYICYTDTNPKTFPVNKNSYIKWFEAERNCRNSYTDLALIESIAENLEVVSAISAFGPSYWFWIGEPAAVKWSWSDLSARRSMQCVLHHGKRSLRCLARSTEERTAHDKKQHAGNGQQMLLLLLGETRNRQKPNATGTCELQPETAFYCYDLVQEKQRSVLKIQFQSDLDMSDPRIYRTLLEKIQERFSQSGGKVIWKTPPTKIIKKSDANPTCALRVYKPNYPLVF